MPTALYRLTCLLALVAPLSLPATAAAAPAHPKLLFDAADVPALKARLAGPLAPVSKALAAGVNYPYESGDFPKTPSLSYTYFDDRRAIADTLAAYAFAALVFEGQGDAAEDRARELAVGYLDGICAYKDWVFPETQDSADPDLNLGHFLFDVALAYDWLHGSLSEPQRQACRAAAAREGRKMYLAAREPFSDASAWWVEEYLQNHHWINHAGLGMAALAFEGEIDEDTSAWLLTATTALDKARSVLDLIDGGAWHEGPGYLNYGLSALIPFSAANVRLKAGVDFAKTAIVRDLPAFRLYGMPPSQEHRREFLVYGDFSGLENDQTLLPVRYAAATFDDGLARHYAAAFSAGKTQGKGGFTTWPPGQRSLALSALYADDGQVTPPPAPGAAWALDHYAPDLSMFQARSGWDDGGALVGFKTGVYGGHANLERLKNKGAPGGSLDWGHDHADDMSVYLFADGEWLTSTVPAYYIGRDNGTPQGNRTKYANSLLVDGQGQLGEGVHTCGLASCPWFFERTSSIPLRGSTAHYAHALGAGSKLYDGALGLQTFGRSVFFVDRATVLVRDVIQASAPRTFEIVYHALDKASRDGGWLKLDAKNDRALGVRVLSPASFSMQTEALTAVHLDKFDPDGSMTAARIRPEQAAASVTFLTALVPARSSSWDKRRSVEPLDPAAPDRGARVDDEVGQSLVVFADDPAESTSLGGIALTGMAGARRVEGGKTVRAAVASGSSLSLDGTPWIEILDGAPASLEVELAASSVVVSGDVVPARLYAPGASSVLLNGKEVPFTVDGDHVVLGASAGAGGSGGSSGSAGAAGSAGPGGSAGSAGSVGGSAGAAGSAGAGSAGSGSAGAGSAGAGSAGVGGGGSASAGSASAGVGGAGSAGSAGAPAGGGAQAGSAGAGGLAGKAGSAQAGAPSHGGKAGSVANGSEGSDRVEEDGSCSASPSPARGAGAWPLVALLMGLAGARRRKARSGLTPR